MALADPPKLAIGVHLAAYRASSLNLRLTESAGSICPVKVSCPVHRDVISASCAKTLDVSVGSLDPYKGVHRRAFEPSPCGNRPVGISSFLNSAEPLPSACSWYSSAGARTSRADVNEKVTWVKDEPFESPSSLRIGPPRRRDQ